MILLDYPSTAPSSAFRLGDFEDASYTWAHDPARLETVDLGQHGDVPMVELSLRLDPVLLPPLPRGLVPSTNDSRGHPDDR